MYKRQPKQIVDCAVAGADIVTTGLAVYKDSIKHAYTRHGLETFQNAWDNDVYKRQTSTEPKTSKIPLIVSDTATALIPPSTAYSCLLYTSCRNVLKEGL